MNGRKRTFSELRKLILMALLAGQQTTNQISLTTGINWRTVEAHLTFLVGKGLVNEVLKSEYVRIFELTEEGKRHAGALSALPISTEPEQAEQKEVIQL